MRKRSNEKMYPKRVRDGASRMMAVSQMDFQGRREPCSSEAGAFPLQKEECDGIR